MQARIETITSRKLVGLSKAMSTSDDRTAELWRAFMPRRREVENRVGTDFYSVKRYDLHENSSLFAPHVQFRRWAAVEVKNFDKIPEGMESYTLTGGKYAVFRHHGLPSEFFRTFQFIFGKWLPATGNSLDQRDHFEILSQDYRPDDPEAEEDIWIPIK